MQRLHGVIKRMIGSRSKLDSIWNPKKEKELKEQFSKFFVSTITPDLARIFNNCEELFIDKLIVG
jgi:hypothetical protein